MNNKKIKVLGVGKGVKIALDEEIVHIHGVDREFVGMSDRVPMEFQVQLNDCERIVKEKFSDTDMMFVIVFANEADELSLAVEIANKAKANGILTIGLVMFTYGGREFFEFKNAFKSPFDAMFFLHTYLIERRKTYYSIIECISDLINKSGYVNLDFADVKAILQNAGYCAFGRGYFGGCYRALNAAREVIHDVVSLEGMKRILLSFTTGPEVTLSEMNDAANAIKNAADPDSQVIWGHVIDDDFGDNFRISLIAAYPNS